ncbi:unnamed protein product [Orchesella dallaii]|uniref:Uncharacterized protein n=1 Tax=Orchesella dallaii TaxID=48710 RepID=A0ABP1PTU3_9HEXA
MWLLCLFGLSAVTADYYYSDDLCNTSTILFKNNKNSCICFPIGSYELNVCDGECPFYFNTEYNSACVIIPNRTVAITRKETMVKATISLRVCNVQSGYERRPKRSTPDMVDEAAYDEDQAGFGVEIGSEVIRDQMGCYMERKIAQLTGLNAENGGTEGPASRSKYPVIKLLEYTKHIMAKTCSSVSADFIDLALNVFVNLQLEVYHIHEPYLGYSAYRRIEMAMKRCLAKAEPHVFLNNNTKGSGNNEFCNENMVDFRLFKYIIMVIL